MTDSTLTAVTPGRSPAAPSSDTSTVRQPTPRPVMRRAKLLRASSQDRQTNTTQDSRERNGSSLASRAAEELFLKTRLVGVAGDLSGATQLAMSYIGMWGMAGTLYSYPGMRDGQPDPELRSRINLLLDDQLELVKKSLMEEEPLVHAVAEALLAKEELIGEDLDQLVQEHGIGTFHHLENLLKIQESPEEATENGKAAAENGGAAAPQGAGTSEANGEPADGEDDSLSTKAAYLRSQNEETPTSEKPEPAGSQASFSADAQESVSEDEGNPDDEAVQKNPDDT